MSKILGIEIMTPVFGSETEIALLIPSLEYAFGLLIEPLEMADEPQAVARSYRSEVTEGYNRMYNSVNLIPTSEEK